MPSAGFWSLLAIIAATLLQAGVENSSRRFRADPQPDRGGQIWFWDLIGFLAILLVLGGGFGLFWSIGAPAKAMLAGHLPEWAIPMAIMAGSFIGAFAVFHGASPLATILFGRPIENPVPKRKNYGAHTPWFAGYMSGKTYKVFITDEMLCGALVGSSIDSESVPPKAKEPATWANTTRATLYERIDVTSPAFLALDDRNFHLRFTEITEVAYDPDKRWLQPSVPHSGRLILTDAGRREYDLLLLGEIDAHALRNKISTAVTSHRLAVPAPQ